MNLEKRIKEWYWKLQTIKYKTYEQMHVNGFMWYISIFVVVF